MQDTVQCFFVFIVFSTYDSDYRTTKRDHNTLYVHKENYTGFVDKES
jgi:hypothetical protein